MSTTEQNKQSVKRLFDAFRAGDSDAFDQLIAKNYVQHNLQAGNGLEAVKAFSARSGPSTSRFTVSSPRATSTLFTRTTRR